MRISGKVSGESFKGRFDSCESNLPLNHIQIFSFIDMHHTYLILISSKSVHTVHISDQGLQPLVRYAHDQLQFQFSCVVQADFTSFFVHFGKCFIQKYQSYLGIAVCLLHIKHCKSSQKCHIFRILSFSSGITSCHVIDRIFFTFPSSSSTRSYILKVR